MRNRGLGWFVAVWVWLTGITIGQSPNQQGAITRLDASVLQSRTERGQANGYVPLGSYVTPIGSPPAAQLLIDPKYTFPDFVGASDGTIWVKSGTTLVALTGISSAGGGWTSNNVFIGQLTTGVYGVKVATGSTSLFLQGGSNNRVAVDYNNTIGGSDSGRTGLLWFIGPTGGFKLGAGEVGGAIDHNGFGLTEVLSVAGATSTLNLTTSTLSAGSGNFTFSLAGGAGVVVPSTASVVNATFALNPTSGNLLYGRLGSANTFTAVNTFSLAPVVPDDSWTIGKTSGLQTALNALLAADGTVTATGNLNIGGFKLTSVGNPTAPQDAVTLSYLQGNYTTTPVTNLSVQGGTPIQVSAATGAVIISMPAATGSVSGYLSNTDFATFNAKQAAISASLPLVLTGTTLSINQSNGSTPGFLSAADYTTFAAKESALTFSAPLVRSTNTISLPVATSVVNGYLSAADWTRLDNAANNMIPGAVSGLVKSVSNVVTTAVAGTDFRKPFVAPPASSGAVGVAGDEAYDGSYYYICVATNSWRRIALTTF